MAEIVNKIRVPEKNQLFFKRNNFPKLRFYKMEISLRRSYCYAFSSFVILFLNCILFAEQKEQLSIYEDLPKNIRIAIFYEKDFPFVNNCNLDFAELSEALKQLKYNVKMLDSVSLGNPDIFNIKNSDLLILCGATYPLNEISNVINYMKEGGSVFFIGGPPLAFPVTSKNGKWIVHERVFPFNGAKEIKEAGKCDTLEDCSLRHQFLKANVWEITKTAPRWESKNIKFDVLKGFNLTEKAKTLLPSIKEKQLNFQENKTEFYIMERPSINSVKESFIPLVTADLCGSRFPFNIKSPAVIALVQQENQDFPSSRVLVCGIMNSDKFFRDDNNKYNKLFIDECIKLLVRRDFFIGGETSKLAYGKSERITIDFKNINFSFNSIETYANIYVINEYTEEKSFEQKLNLKTKPRSLIKLEIHLPNLNHGVYKIVVQMEGEKELKVLGKFAVLAANKIDINAGNFLSTSSLGIMEVPSAFGLIPERIFEEYHRDSINFMYFLFLWGTVERSKGTYDFTYIDHFVKQASEKDIKLILDSYYLWSKMNLPDYLPLAVDQYGEKNHNVIDIFSDITQNGFIDLFKALAEKYKNNDAVIGYVVSLFQVSPIPYTQGHYERYYNGNKFHFLLYSNEAQKKFRDYLRNIKGYSLEDVSNIFDQKFPSWENVKPPIPPINLFEKGEINYNANVSGIDFKEKLMLGKPWIEATDWYFWTYENLFNRIVSEIKKISPNKVVILRSYQCDDTAYKVAKRFKNTGVHAECIGDRIAQMYSDITRGYSNSYGVATSLEGNDANTTDKSVIERMFANGRLGGSRPIIYASSYRTLHINSFVLPEYYYQGSLLDQSRLEKSKMGILFPTLLYKHSAYWLNVSRLMNSFFPAFGRMGVPFSLVSSADPSISLSELSVLIDLGCNYLLGHHQQNAILDWIAQGNTFLCFYTIGQYDLLGNKNTFLEKIFKGSFDLKHEKGIMTFIKGKKYDKEGISFPVIENSQVLAKWLDGSPALLKIPYGKGFIVIAGWNPWVWNNNSSMMCDFFKYGTDMDIPIQVTPPICKIIFQRKDNDLLVLIYNELDKPIDCDIYLNPSAIRWKNDIYDLKSFKKVVLEKNSFKIFLKPHEIKFFCLPDGECIWFHRAFTRGSTIPAKWPIR